MNLMRNINTKWKFVLVVNMKFWTLDQIFSSTYDNVTWICFYNTSNKTKRRKITIPINLLRVLPVLNDQFLVLSSFLDGTHLLLITDSLEVARRRALQRFKRNMECMKEIFSSTSVDTIANNIKSLSMFPIHCAFMFDCEESLTYLFSTCSHLSQFWFIFIDWC